jgi:hypothetical protein
MSGDRDPDAINEMNLDLEKGVGGDKRGIDNEIVQDIPERRRRAQTIGWHALTNSIPKRNGAGLKRTDSTSTTTPTVIIRPYGRGGAGRRPAVVGPRILSESEVLARAEAASWAQLTPLMAATFGPLSVMLGIPTLTQRWRGILTDPTPGTNGSSVFEALPDPTLNLALAGVSLFCEVAGNAFLILRFSNYHAKTMTWISYGCWIAKLVICIANYIQFGITYPQGPDIIYLQGFWVSSSVFNIRWVSAVWLLQPLLSGSLLSTLRFFMVKAKKVFFPPL